MENLEKNVIKEINFFCPFVITNEQKTIIIDNISHSLSTYIFSLLDLLVKCKYELHFTNCDLTREYIELFNDLSWFNVSRVQFTNCRYSICDSPINLELIEVLQNKKIAIKEINIDLSSIKVSELKWTGVKLENFLLEKISFELSNSRYINIYSKDVKKILSNKKKVGIGCKAMTLQNWKYFFEYEKYSFNNKRNSIEFQEIKLSFEKFLLLIQE